MNFPHTKFSRPTKLSPATPGSGHQCTYAHETCCQANCTAAGGVWTTECTSGSCPFTDCGAASYSFINPGHPSSQSSVQVQGCYDIRIHSCSYDPLLCCEDSCTAAGISNPIPNEGGYNPGATAPSLYWSDECVDERPGRGEGCAVPVGRDAPICPWQVMHRPDMLPGMAVVNNCECECCLPDGSGATCAARQSEFDGPFSASIAL